MDSTIWLYIALAIVVAGLIVAGIGVGLLIAGMKEPMKEMKGSADNLKERMEQLKLETTALQHHTAELKEDMQEKSEKISLLVDAAKGTKNSVIDLNSAVRITTSDISSRVDRDKRNVAQVNHWNNVVFGLLDLWKKRKARKNSTSTYYPTPAPDDRRYLENN